MNKMSIPEIPWFGPEMTGNEIHYLQKVLSSNFVNDGPLTTELENKIASICNAKFGVAVTSGTVAISLALMSLGIGFGDEVLVPDLTFIATANAVTMIGAKVVLVDIEPNRFGIDLNACRRALTKNTRAIVSVDVNGRGADYINLKKFCIDNGLKLICDAAEALGSSYEGKKIGTFGEATCFSFSANKTVTTGQGGIILTDDEDLQHRLRQLKDQGRPFRGTGGDDLHPALGFNFKFTDIQAAVGLAQLEKLGSRISLMQQRDNIYVANLKDFGGIKLPDFDSQQGEVRQWFDILVDNKSKIQKALKDVGINSRAFWHPLHVQAPYLSNSTEFPVAAEVSARGLWLPSSFSISHVQIENVCDVIKNQLL